MDERIIIRGAREHNLKNIDVTFPLNCLVVVSGVSGSGKSSLIKNCMFATYEKKKQGLHLSQIIKRSDATVSGISGLDNIDEMILVDQSPVGNTPRSNAATYTKAWEIVREAFAETAAATALGLSKSAFSFNVDGGRCPVCKGAGYQKIEMQLSLIHI